MDCQFISRKQSGSIVGSHYLKAENAHLVGMDTGLAQQLTRSLSLASWPYVYCPCRTVHASLRQLILRQSKIFRRDRKTNIKMVRNSSSSWALNKTVFSKHAANPDQRTPLRLQRDGPLQQHATPCSHRASGASIDPKVA